MKITTHPIAKLPTKLLASMLVLGCLVLGAIGLVLPIIPGLLFLAIGIVIVARHFPSLERRLRGHRTIGRHLDTADGFASLTVWDKVQLGSLLGVKLLLDGIVFIGAVGTKLLTRAAEKYQTDR